jgi:predicted transcriptional regulator
MIIYVEKQSVPFFEALASEVRVEILRLLAKESLNIKQLAEKLGISSSIMTRHIQKLESAGLVKASMVTVDGAIQKKCVIIETEYRIQMPHREITQDIYEVSIPVGHYSEIDVTPTCGLATEDCIIGYFDEPKFLMDPQRMNAQILWFTQGYVEYAFPNYLQPSQTLRELHLSLELSSEAPGYNEDWPSDITFYVNGVRLFDWTCPGDFGERHGIITPMWWQANQYGLLKQIRIDGSGTYLDEEKRSGVTIRDIENDQPTWRLKLEVGAQATHVGGLTVYGKKFGNHSQDILVRTFYTVPEDERAKVKDFWYGRNRTMQETFTIFGGHGGQVEPE